MTATESDLNINGTEVMETTGLDAGPRIGWILEVLLKEVNTNSIENENERLRKRAKILSELKDIELQELSQPIKENNGELRKWIERSLQIFGLFGIIYTVYSGEMPWDWL